MATDPPAIERGLMRGTARQPEEESKARWRWPARAVGASARARAQALTNAPTGASWSLGRSFAGSSFGWPFASVAGRAPELRAAELRAIEVGAATSDAPSRAVADARSRRRERQGGQGIVEFSLVIPLFITALLGILEFGLLFSAQNSINFASRDAALVAAELGNTNGADCVIIQKVVSDVGAPADPSLIQSITISWTDTNGVVQTDPNTGLPYSNVWTPGGSTTCSFPAGDVTVPYTESADNYPVASRCNILAGCPAPHDGGLDTIGVRIVYQYSYHTPLSTILSWGGSGWTLDQSNAMRMEPIL